MSRFNEAELHGMKELDPQGFICWQLPKLDADLEWYTWLESQVAPPAGMPFLRGGCVAGFRSRSGTQAPWAYLIEAQAQPVPRFASKLLVYLGLLHEDLRHGPHDLDRFQMMAAVLNLTDTTLATTIDWVPSGGGGVLGEFPPRNVRREKAAETLEAIASGKTALCILVRVPLMEGGDRPEVLARWRELAARQTVAYLRADYVALALVFADLAGRGELWESELKEFDVEDSRIAKKWDDRAFDRGTVVGQIRLCQELLHLPIQAEKDLRKLPKAELTQLLDQLRGQLVPNGH